MSAAGTGARGGRNVTLFLCGDVMTGRGIDQVLPHPSSPDLHERHLDSALEYVHLAEKANGPIPRPVELSYVWGDALGELDRVAPDFRLINLETAITTSEDYDRGKQVHYRMHPANVDCLRASGVDCCILANNHILDWGRPGLLETLQTLERAGIATAGAGRDLDEAIRPTSLSSPEGGRVLVFASGSQSAGVPAGWAAGPGRPGVWLIDERSPGTINEVASAVAATRKPGDLVVFSIHWGGNWGYLVPNEQRRLAHELIASAGVDVVYGHSSHHVKGIEVYRDRLILYGCGDFLTDYEGISGYEQFRGDLGLMYFAELDAATGSLVRLSMTPTQPRRFRLAFPTEEDGRWLVGMLNRECRSLGTSVERTSNGRLLLRW